MNPELPKTVADVAAAAVGFAAFLEFLPAIAAGATIIWLGFRMYHYIRFGKFGD